MVYDAGGHKLSLSAAKVAVIGLGYVGLPLAVQVSKYRPVIGYDINQRRVDDLRSGIDITLEVDGKDLLGSGNLEFTNSVDKIAGCNLYIVTVPTPIDSCNLPDLKPLRSASEAVGQILLPGDVVVFESTVYPGATEEECVPILERASSLRFNEDFFVGYSPERINPGDHSRRLNDIIKVTSGSTAEAADFIDEFYASIISAGTYKAPSIGVAEAAKVIENTQRDLNIALMNELSIIFTKMGLNTEEVLKAAETKWNFIPFRPGLVGGHCISVDPYYLLHKAKQVGLNPEIIASGRAINGAMGRYVAHQLLVAMKKKNVNIRGARILILGLTFKENCPDTRNTRVVDIIDELHQEGCVIDVYDPLVEACDHIEMKSFSLITNPQANKYSGIIIAVPHGKFYELGVKKIHDFGSDPYVLYDLKWLLPSENSDLRL